MEPCVQQRSDQLHNDIHPSAIRGPCAVCSRFSFGYKRQSSELFCVRMDEPQKAHHQRKEKRI
jgi:hypothetical protein